MSNYKNLKTSIDANIKQNGNQEITGPILNSVLNQMVNILGTGYQFAGIATLDPATEPGTPDAKVFYIANGKGTYTNFGGIEVTEDDVVVLYWDSAWHKVATGIASQAKLSELDIETKERINQVISTFAELLDFQSIQPVNVINRKYINRNGETIANEEYKINVYSVVPGFYIILNDVNGIASLTADYAFVGDVNCNSIVSIEQWEAKQYYTLVKIPSGVQYLAINWDGQTDNLRTLSTANSELLINPQIVNQAIAQVETNKQAIGEIDGVLPKNTPPLTLVSSIDGYPSSPSGIIGGDSRWKTDIYSINGALKLKLEHKCNTPNFVIVFSNSTTINTDTIIGAVAYNSTTGANTQQDIDVPSGAMYVGVYRDITNSISSYSYVNFGEKINNISTPVYNYNKWFNLWGQLPVPNSDKTNTGIWGNVEVGSDFNAFGASRYIKFDKTSEQTNFQIFTLAKEEFRQEFISGKKIKIEFLLKSSAALKNQTFSIYYMHGNYKFGILTSTQITTNANEIKKVELTTQVPDTDIDTTQYLTFYFTGVASSIYKMANIIITDVVDTKNSPQNILSKNDLRVDLREYDLQNKECIYIGDSISTGYYWREYLESEYMLKYVRNKSGLTPAEGGIKVMPVENEESATKKSIWYRCANNRMSNYQFDIISLMGGTNDMNISDEIGFTVGTINDKPYVDDASSFDTPSNYVDIWSNNLTFAQCLMGCVEMLRRDFPEKPIILGTVMPCGHSYGNTEVGGVKLSERIAMLQMNIAEKYGIFCVPLYWGARNTTTINSFSIDGVHPNKQQGRIMMAEYAKILCL